jgi:hypothetical protein
MVIWYYQYRIHAIYRRFVYKTLYQTPDALPRHWSDFFRDRKKIAAYRCCKPVTHTGAIIGYPALIKAMGSHAPAKRLPPK